MLNPILHFHAQQVVNLILQKCSLNLGIRTVFLSTEIQAAALISSFLLPAEIYLKCVYVP